MKKNFGKDTYDLIYKFLKADPNNYVRIDGGQWGDMPGTILDVVSNNKKLEAHLREVLDLDAYGGELYTELESNIEIVEGQLVQKCIYGYDHMAYDGSKESREMDALFEGIFGFPLQDSELIYYVNFDIEYENLNGEDLCNKKELTVRKRDDDSIIEIPKEKVDEFFKSLGVGNGTIPTDKYSFHQYFDGDYYRFYDYSAVDESLDYLKGHGKPFELELED